MGESERALAERQFGVVSRQQAIALGLTRSAIEWRLESGQWLRMDEGVFRLAGAPRCWKQTALAAVLSAGDAAVLSYRTAGYLYGFDGMPHEPLPIDVTVPRGRNVTVRSARVHTTSGKFYRASVGIFPVTSPAKTIVDLATVLAPESLEIALDSAQRQFPRIGRWVTRQVGQRPRLAPGIRTLKELLAQRQDGATDSPLEVRVRRKLRGSGLPRPTLQHIVFDAAGAYVMRVDLAWPLHKVALHVDSYLWHGQRERFDRDAKQRAQLAALGWLSLSVTHRNLFDGDWLRALGAALKDREPQRSLPLLDAARPNRSRKAG